MAHTWLFFDLGNTLIDESVGQSDRARRMAVALGLVGVHCTAASFEAEMRKAAANFAPVLVSAALLNILGTEAAVPALRKAAPFNKTLDRPYPDANGVLELLGARYRMAVIANQSAGTEGRLASYGMMRHFSFVLSSTEEGLEKPEPAFFLRALEKAGCNPSDAVMIGDRLDNDIAPAKRIGFATIRILTGNFGIQRPRNADEVADATVESLAELPATLADLAQRTPTTPR